MAKSEKKRQFILRFYKAINGAKKNKELLSQFTTDPKLIEHLLFLEELLPKFSLNPQEITTEQERVIVRAILTGKHTGKVEGIEPTQKTVKTVFATGYKIEKNKIVDHWFITDEMVLIKQLGLSAHLDKMPGSSPDL